MAWVVPYIPQIIAAVGAGASVYSAGKQGQTAAAGAAYNQAAANAEAEQMDRQAKAEIAAGTHNADRIAQRTREILAQQRAGAAAGGGSALDATVNAIQMETVRTSAVDQLLTMADAEERAAQMRYGADIRRNYGVFTGAMGKEAQTAGYIKAGATLMSAASDWGDKYGWPGTKTSAPAGSGGLHSGGRRN